MLLNESRVGDRSGPITCERKAHQKISAPATPGEQTSPVHGAARVQAATCQSQLARPRKAGKSQCATATALDVSSSVARAPTIGAHFPRVRFKGPSCCCNKKNRTLNRKLDLRARARAGHFPGFFWFILAKMLHFLVKMAKWI